MTIFKIIISIVITIVFIVPTFGNVPVTETVTSIPVSDTDISIRAWCVLYHSNGGAGDVFFDTVDNASVTTWEDFELQLFELCLP